MPNRFAVFLLLFASSLSAQFFGLSSTTDGASLYFATTLRLKGAPPLLNGKIFAAAQGSVSLFRAHDPAAPAAGLPCSAGGFSDYLSAETAGSGIVSLLYRANSAGGCSYPANPLITQIVTSAGETNLPGIVRLSPDGRHAFSFLATTGRVNSSFTLAFLDLQTGVQTPVVVPAPPFPGYASFPTSGGRVVANDGTAILGITDISAADSGYLLKPGADAQPFPVAGAFPLVIDSGAAKVLYQKQQAIYLFDLQSLASTLLIPAGQPAANFRMSDDARRLIYIGAGQLHLLDTTSLTDRALTSDPDQITGAALSGDGKVVYTVTGTGRLLKINADDATQIELIGHTPYLAPFNSILFPGFTATLYGSGLSSSVINGTVPLTAYLGNVTMWIGERKVPMIQLTPGSVTFLPPWDIAPAGGPIRMLAEAPGDHTPFYYPEAETTVAPSARQAGAVARQDWSQTYSGPVNTGEIIHVFAAGFGPVSPEVPAGAAAPAIEPLSRLTQSLTCSNAEILYAGLAPFAVERTYQIDIRIGPTAGYQKFLCSLGGGPAFNFLTLNVVQ